MAHLDVPVVGSWLGQSSSGSPTCYWGNFECNIAEKSPLQPSQIASVHGILVAALGTQFVGISSLVALGRLRVLILAHLYSPVLAFYTYSMSLRVAITSHKCHRSWRSWVRITTNHSFRKITSAILRFFFSNQDASSLEIRGTTSAPVAALTSSNLIRYQNYAQYPGARAESPRRVKGETGNGSATKRKWMALMDSWIAGPRTRRHTR